MASSNTNDNKKENNGDNLPLGRDPFEAANGDNAPTPPSADGRDYLIDGEVRVRGKWSDEFPYILHCCCGDMDVISVFPFR